MAPGGRLWPLHSMNDWQGVVKAVRIYLAGRPGVSVYAVVGWIDGPGYLLGYVAADTEDAAFALMGQHVEDLVASITSGAISVRLVPATENEFDAPMEQSSRRAA